MVTEAGKKLSKNSAPMIEFLGLRRAVQGPILQLKWKVSQ